MNNSRAPIPDGGVVISGDPDRDPSVVAVHFDFEGCEVMIITYDVRPTGDWYRDPELVVSMDFDGCERLAEAYRTRRRD